MLQLVCAECTTCAPPVGSNWANGHPSLPTTAKLPTTPAPPPSGLITCAPGTLGGPTQDCKVSGLRALPSVEQVRVILFSLPLCLDTFGAEFRWGMAEQGIAQRTVCFDGEQGDAATTCLSHVTIGVVHCGDFILWQLPNVPNVTAGGGCPGSYCTTGDRSPLG